MGLTLLTERAEASENAKNAKEWETRGKCESFRKSEKCNGCVKLEGRR